MAALMFKDADKAKAAIMSSQKKEIEKLYKDWAKEIEVEAKRLSKGKNVSDQLKSIQSKQLMKNVEAASKQVSNEIYGLIKENMYTVSDAVVKSNSAWMSQLGFDETKINANFTTVPDQIVRRLVTGQIYESGWSLSGRIWGNNEETMSDLYKIMARGLTENLSIQEIAKSMSAYVNPQERKGWNKILAMKNTKTGQIEYKRIYSKKVDYNAQRLARTLVQHSYQQSFVAVTKNNPFVTDYIWHADGSRPCELCEERDGMHFAKDDLPMDHPNGMCTMEPNVDEHLIDHLADWVNSPEGTYPEIDEFATNFGYNASKSDATAIKDKFTEAGFKRITGSHDYKSDAIACNPRALIDDEHNYEYWQNCSHTVPTYEMRRRGYDVTATGALNNDKFKAAGMRAWGYKDHNEAYKAGAVNFVNAKRSNKIADEIAQELVNAGEGARFEIRVGWKTGGGHFFVGENVNGEAVFIDPQSGDIGDVVKNYMFESKPSATWYTRIDDIELDPEIMKELMR